MAVQTPDAAKAGTTDWRAHVYIDNRSDVFAVHIGTRRFPTAPLARAWVTRKLRGTTPLEPEHLAWGSIEQFHWKRVTGYDSEFGTVIGAEAEPVEDSGQHAYKTEDGSIVWDDEQQNVGP